MSAREKRVQRRKREGKNRDIEKRIEIEKKQETGDEKSKNGRG